jgi:hypothetical protein
LSLPRIIPKKIHWLVHFLKLIKIFEGIIIEMVSIFLPVHSILFAREVFSGSSGMSLSRVLCGQIGIRKEQRRREKFTGKKN